MSKTDSAVCTQPKNTNTLPQTRDGSGYSQPVLTREKSSLISGPKSTFDIGGILLASLCPDRRRKSRLGRVQGLWMRHIV